MKRSSMRMTAVILILAMLMGLTACAGKEKTTEEQTTGAPLTGSAFAEKPTAEATTKEPETEDAGKAVSGSAKAGELPEIAAGETAQEKSVYTDANGDKAVVPAQFTVSAEPSEQTIDTGLVVIGPDGSEFVWIPTTETTFQVRDFGSYFSGGDRISRYEDETDLESYQEMRMSVKQNRGFYIGRYEASKGADSLPQSKPVTKDNPGSIWVQFSPQDTVGACERLYADNDTVQGFFPWGINWDTMLQWLIDSGCLTEEDVSSDSTDWGNYSDDTFSKNAKGNYTGVYQEACTNNIYDLAGNNWEWTQERSGSSYVMRGGGYNLMGGSCSGARYPAAIRDPLPGNNHHPNVTFRVGLFIR